jgi:ribosome biogenesis GTPase
VSAAGNVGGGAPGSAGVSRPGLVIQHGANRYLVEESHADPLLPWACALRGRLRKGRQEVVRLAVIGDRVLFTPRKEGQQGPVSPTGTEPPEGTEGPKGTAGRAGVVAADSAPNGGGTQRTERTGVIDEVLPRRNKISRPAPTGDGRRSREQVVIANLDCLWVVVARDEPAPSVRFVDRVLASASHQGVPAGLIVNKSELASGEDPAALAALYEGLGYPVVLCSVATGEGIERLRLRLREGIHAFVGPSGAGKSSLLTRLQPHLSLRVASVMERTGLGRHTTTTSRLYRLEAGGYLADTPGMREFGLWGMTRADLAPAFVEIAREVGECRFRDCLHVEEPGCAVRAALQAGRIDPGRYASYSALLAELPGAGAHQDEPPRRGGR